MAYNTSYNQSIRETPYYVFFLRDPKLPYSELLKSEAANPSSSPPSKQHTTVTDYCTELTKRARSVFKICKSYSEEQMLKRNDRLNVDRKFKEIQVGDRIYIKNEIAIF